MENCAIGDESKVLCVSDEVIESKRLDYDGKTEEFDDSSLPSLRPHPDDVIDIPFTAQESLTRNKSRIKSVELQNVFDNVCEFEAKHVPYIAEVIADTIDDSDDTKSFSIGSILIKA